LHPNSQRFLTARSLYHALLTSQNSQRLVTTAHSWDQKAARAFAAELIAPQQALATRIQTSAADEQIIEELSREFNVSTMVIEWQLVNAGIPLSVE
jgi:Zn-dependent peptidase ImmA (M78 family)